MAQPVDETISQVDEIQDQIRNQERLLAQLHESILQQDQQLLGREAEAQTYATKLKKLQSRHIHDQKGHDTATQDTSKSGIQDMPKFPEPKSQMSGSRSSGSLTLLRQKVEESRLKVAQRGRQEQESKRELEEKVLALKSQLEEFQRAAVTTNPPVPEENPVDMQMVALQEQIQAKDSLIEARTRAITLLTEDFARKRKEVVDQLDETREEMRHMQENFISSEDRYKSEIQARDIRLFEMDSKLRTLNAKLEQTEDLNLVRAEKENLQKQVNDLIAIKSEKESLEEKIKELVNVQNMYQQKEAEVSIILGEKLKLEAELVEINRKREEESRKTQSLQKKIEKLSKQLQLNESKMNDMNTVLSTCQANEEKLISLSLEKQSLEEKVEELRKLADSQQQIQMNKSALIESSPDQENEKILLLKEKGVLQHKLKSIVEYFSVPQRDLKRPSAKKQDHTKKLQEIIELTKMLLAVDEKMKDFHQSVQTDYMASEPIPDKLQLEEKFGQLSALLDIYKQTINDLNNMSEVDDAKLIMLSIETKDNITVEDKEELRCLVERNKQNVEKIDSLARALIETKQELQQQAVLINACQFNETELKTELDGYQNKCSNILQESKQLECKVNQLADLLKTIHAIRSKEMAALCEEKDDLKSKIESVTKYLYDIESMLQIHSDTNKEETSQELLSLLHDKQILMEKLKELLPLFKSIEDRFDSLSKCQQHQEQQLTSFLIEPDVSSNQLQSFQEQCSEELLMCLQEKRQLQHNLDDLSKIVVSKKQVVQGLTDQLALKNVQYKEEMSSLVQEKEKLELELHGMSVLVSAEEESVQRLNDELMASKEQYDKELATLLQERQQLDMKVDELSMVIAAKEHEVQGLHNQITTSKERYSEEVSSLLQGKQELEVKVDELSALIAAREQNIEGLSDQLTASKDQYGEELTMLLQEKQQLELKVDGLSVHLADKEQIMQRLNDQFTASKEQYCQELTTLFQEKQQLELKVDELSTHVNDKEMNIQRLLDQQSTNKEHYDEELSSFLQEKQQFEVKVDELLKLVTDKEQNILRLTDQLRASTDKLTTLLEEKQQLEVKVDELLKLVTDKEESVKELNDQLALRKKQFNEEMATLLQEKQLLEEEIHELSVQVADKGELCNQLTANKEQYSGELTTLLQDKQQLELKIDELSKLVADNDQNTQELREEQRKEVEWLLSEAEQHNKDIVEMHNRLVSKDHSIEELKVEISNNQQAHFNELASVHEEKQVLQSTVSENVTVISSLEQKVKSLNEELKSLKLQNEEFASLLEEKQKLQGKVMELSNVIISHEQNIQALKDHLSSSQQQHLQVKQQLEDEVHRLSNLITWNESNLQVCKDELTSVQKELSLRLKEKQQLEETCVEYSKLLEASEQRLKQASEEKNGMLAHLETRQMDISHEEKRQLIEEQFVQRSVAPSVQAPVMESITFGVPDSQHYHNEWAALLAERQFLQQKVEELYFYLKQSVQGLKELKFNIGEEINTEIADSLDYVSYDQIDLASLLGEYKTNLEHLKKQMLYILTLTQEKQNLEDHFKNIQTHLHRQVEEKAESLIALVQQKTALEKQVDEVSSLLKQAEEREEQMHQQNTVFREQLNSLVKENVSNAMVIDLQNRIAELEEEKAEGADLTAEVEALRSQKVAAEMKGVELEEELDLLKRGDNAGLIDSLNVQMKDQVDTCRCLSETLKEREVQLGDVQKKYSDLYQETQDQLVKLQASVQEKETVVDEYKERLTHAQASLDEVLDINNCIKRSIEKFCSDIVHGSLDEYPSHMTGDSMDSIEEVKYLKSEEELISILSSARSILAEKEVFLQSLKAQISKTQNDTLHYENSLKELEILRRENALLQTKVNDFQLMLIEKEKEIEEVAHEASEKERSSDEAVQNQLKQLELEKERLTEELKAAQVRSGKLIKKIKSLKTDYDLLTEENLKLSSIVSSGSKVEQDDWIVSLQQEILKLQSELEKKLKKMDDASTQANDDHLTWLSNEYENVKHEVQHLIEEIEYKDDKSLQMAEQLQSKDNTIEELAKTVESLTESLQEREHKLVHFETSQEHSDKGGYLPLKVAESHRKELDHVLHMLRQKEEEVAHLEELLQQRVHGESDDDLGHKEGDEHVLKQLDDALYLLHQKEVRCDELTLELMQLLEERDTLQLRLSTTIRQYEELRATCSHAQERGVQSASSSPALTNKLKEVRSVGREQRTMALQQRADTTVSRDNLSQSETLMNWIRGRTTPKVMHI